MGHVKRQIFIFLVIVFFIGSLHAEKYSKFCKHVCFFKEILILEIKGDVTRYNLKQRFFAQHRVNFSRYVKRVNFSHKIVQNVLGNMHVTRDDFSAAPTRNISRARPGHVEQNSGKVLREKSTATLLHESTV